MRLAPPVRDVPCGDCRLCCKGEAVFLLPEYGDDVSAYETRHGLNPLSGQVGHQLQTQPNGDCIYLGEAGCSIHDRRPVLCRSFSCVVMYLSVPRAERKRREKKVPGYKELAARGRELSEQGVKP